jgi:hypothetical protein
MKTPANHLEFNPEHPEAFNWATLDSPTLSILAAKFATAIYRDLKTQDRVNTPGLRFALNEIAQIAYL